MLRRTRYAIAMLVTFLFIGTSSRAVVAPVKPCAKTFTLSMFKRAALSTYRGVGDPRRGSYGHLWRYARCQRPPGTERAARRLWARAHAAWARHRHPEMAYGAWPIPRSIVMCESRGENLPPNSASASGYFQIIASTWAAYGGLRYASEAWRASRTEQAIVAARIWRSGGPSQWVCAALVGY